MPTIEDEAYSYYTQRGFTVDKGHAIWTVALLPLYEFWKGLADSGHPLADLVKPGPLASLEIPTSWGRTQQASEVRVSNRVVGVHNDPAGWLPYQIELY